MLKEFEDRVFESLVVDAQVYHDIDPDVMVFGMVCVFPVLTVDRFTGGRPHSLQRLDCVAEDNRHKIIDHDSEYVDHWSDCRFCSEFAKQARRPDSSPFEPVIPRTVVSQPPSIFLKLSDQESDNFRSIFQAREISKRVLGWSFHADLPKEGFQLTK
jgi:hypothetical protein